MSSSSSARRIAFGLAITAAVASCTPSGAMQVTSEEHPFRVVTIAKGLEHPWGIAFLPGGDLLVTERPGRLQRIRLGSNDRIEITGTPEVWAHGQGGLLDVALSPQFPDTPWVYLTYSKPGRGGATTALARGRLEDDRLTGLEDLFTAEAYTTTGQHFGSRIVFDDSGHVFLGIGDRGVKQEAQNPENHQGAIVRLNLDGTVPPDNPFVRRAGFRPEIWSYGHRSPQGMTRHPLTGALWENEHGPRGGDEVNLIAPGRNYGWPAITFGIDYDGSVISNDTAREGMEQPVLYWVPSIAVSGMTFYAGDRFPRWRGNAFVGALAGEHLRRIVFDGVRPIHQEVVLRPRVRIRQVREGPDGLLYLLTDEDNGAVLRLEPVAQP